MIKLIYSLFLVTILVSCASVQAPQGGPKDDTPPKLIESNPIQGASQFSEKQITLIFDESVVENNTKQAFLSPYTPTTSKPSQKKLRIEPDSGFLKNTTYTLRLNEKIKDEKEGTVMKDTTLIFSTGNELDSLKITVNHLGINKKLNTDKSILLLKDTAGKTYFAQKDGSQKLVVQGLHKGKYRLELFKDANENYRYDQDEGTLWFEEIQLDTALTLSLQPLPHESRLLKTFKQRRKDTLFWEGNRGFKMTEKIQSMVIYQSPKKDKYWLYPFQKTILTEINDSLGNCFYDTLDFSTIDSTRSFESVENKPTISIRTVKKGMIIDWEFPWKIARKPLLTEITLDSVWTTVQPEINENKIRLPIPFQNTGKLKIRFDSLGFYNQKGWKLDSVIIDKQDITPFGEISGTIQTTIGQPIIVELLNNKKELVSRLKGPDFRFYVRPGSYQLQTFIDWDGNGFYTGGNKNDNRKAEPLFAHPEIVELKPGWDIEKLVIIPGF